MSSTLTYYWDASVFVAYFSDEEKRADIVESLLEEGRDGKLTIVTSSFTLVEVIKLRGHKPLSPKDERILREFFDYSFIKLVDTTRKIGEDARMLIWKYSYLKPKDAVHLASALEFASRQPLAGLFAYDEDFVRLNKIVTTSFEISAPYVHQTTMKLKFQNPKSVPDDSSDVEKPEDG